MINQDLRFTTGGAAGAGLNRTFPTGTRCVVTRADTDGGRYLVSPVDNTLYRAVITTADMIGGTAFWA